MFNMDIKTQKIIRFIPMVNFITVIFWFIMYYKNPIPKKRLYKKLLIIACACVSIMILEIILESFIKTDIAITIINFITSYLSLLAFSFVAVQDQEKYFNNPNTHE